MPDFSCASKKNIPKHFDRETVNSESSTGRNNTDSGRTTFDEETANKAVIEFKQYSDNLSKLVVDALHAPGLNFYLNARSATTNYSQLLSQMTYRGCSGRLGLAVRECVSKFKDKEQAVCISLNSHVILN